MTIKKDKQLFIWYTAFGDRIAQIPYLLKMKELNKNITLLDYEKWWVNYSWNMKVIYDFFKNNWLYENIITIPYWFFKFLKFIFTIILKFHSFNESYSPVWTKASMIIWHFFCKKVKNTFKNNDDNSEFENIVEWMIGWDNKSFYEYSKQLKIPYSKEYKKKFWLYDSYVTVFCGPYSWSLKIEEWRKLFDFIINNWLKIVLLWGENSDREWWILEVIENDKNIINLLWKTNFEELCSIISDADYTISANWGIMRLSHLLNIKSVSFSIVSWKILHPPCDNHKSFHIHSNKCSHPCEIRVGNEKLKKMSSTCIFYGTEKNRSCRNMKADSIIKILNSVYTS